MLLGDDATLGLEQRLEQPHAAPANGHRLAIAEQASRDRIQDQGAEREIRREHGRTLHERWPRTMPVEGGLLPCPVSGFRKLALHSAGSACASQAIAWARLETASFLRISAKW